MSKLAARVVIIDNDASFCRSTEHLFRSVGLQVQVFGTALQFLYSRRPDPPACVMLEVLLPGLSGLDLQRHLLRAGIGIPLLFVTGHGNIPQAVQAMKAGAVDFLTKPIQEHELLDRLQQGFQRDQALCEHRRQLGLLRDNYELLTPCERAVMTCVVSGLLNKQSAAALGITEKTVKFHRGHVMRKMRAQSVVDLARMAEYFCILPPSIPAADGGPEPVETSGWAQDGDGGNDWTSPESEASNGSTQALSPLVANRSTYGFPVGIKHR